MFTPLGPQVPPPFALPPWGTPLRRLLSRALHLLSWRLGHMAVQLAAGHVARAEPGALPSIEFHAEAGALEGALYIDGVLVGHLVGVSRL